MLNPAETRTHTLCSRALLVRCPPTVLHDSRAIVTCRPNSSTTLPLGHAGVHSTAGAGTGGARICAARSGATWDKRSVPRSDSTRVSERTSDYVLPRLGEGIHNANTSLLAISLSLSLSLSLFNTRTADVQVGPQRLTAGITARMPSRTACYTDSSASMDALRKWRRA